MSGSQYIYSVINENQHRKFNIFGLEEGPVYTINFRDLAAVASLATTANFDKLNEETLKNYAASHQRVNEELLKNYDVVPMAFGMVAGSEDEVREILGKAYIQLKRSLKKIDNKIEFVVYAFWDEKTVLNDLINNDPDIKRLKEEVESAGKVFGMSAKIKLGKLIVETLKSYKDHYSKDIEEKLKGCSYDIKRAKLLDQNTVSNLSVLIDKFREAELDRKMQGLGEYYKDKLRFKYIGPMAPGSFVNINLSLGNFEVLNGARKALGVPKEASFSEIKGIYLGLAKKYHPDKHEYKNDPEVVRRMTEKMKEVQDAYEALESYCRLCPSPVFGDTYSFRKEDVAKTLLVKE